MKLRVKLRAEGLHRTYCRYFPTNLLMLYEEFLIALTSTEYLFLERPLYKRFLHNITYPISSNLCKKISLQCNQTIV